MSEVSTCVTLKLASSLDGRIALSNGQSKWITSEESRAQVHKMRATHDVLLTGIGTVLVDNPQLTARPEETLTGGQPVRAVLDSQLRTPADAALFQSGGRVIIFHIIEDEDKAGQLRDKGAELIKLVPGREGRPEFEDVIKMLFKMGLNQIMIEAGAYIVASALKSGLVDQIEWFRSPKLLGADSLPVVSALELDEVNAAPEFERVSVRPLSVDIWESYKRIKS